MGNGADAGLDGAIGITAELEILHHALAKRCHEILSKKEVRESDVARLVCSIAPRQERATESSCYPPKADCIQQVVATASHSREGSLRSLGWMCLQLNHKR